MKKTQNKLLLLSCASAFTLMACGTTVPEVAAPEQTQPEPVATAPNQAEADPDSGADTPTALGGFSYKSYYTALWKAHLKVQYTGKSLDSIYKVSKTAARKAYNKGFSPKGLVNLIGTSKLINHSGQNPNSWVYSSKGWLLTIKTNTLTNISKPF